MLEREIEHDDADGVSRDERALGQLRIASRGGCGEHERERASREDRAHDSCPVDDAAERGNIMSVDAVRALAASK